MKPNITQLYILKALEGSVDGAQYVGITTQTPPYRIIRKNWLIEPNGQGWLETLRFVGTLKACIRRGWADVTHEGSSVLAVPEDFDLGPEDFDLGPEGPLKMGSIARISEAGRALLAASRVLP